MSEQNANHPARQTRRVVLINAEDNPVAQIDDRSFKGDWRWLKAPPSWTPDQELPSGDGPVDALIVFAAKYQEDEIRDFCRRLRGVPALQSIPLLVAVDQYQMPLANRVREMPNTDFVVTPIEEASLTHNLDRARESRS